MLGTLDALSGFRGIGPLAAYCAFCAVGMMWG
jgi:hypothetical protein